MVLKKLGCLFIVQALHLMRQWTCEETVSMEEMAYLLSFCTILSCIEVTLHVKIY